MAKKRGSNEGSIFKRKDGRWCALVNLGWVNGKRTRKAFYGRSRKVVAEALNKATREKAQGLPVAVERQSVGQFLERWLVESVRPSVRPQTFEQYAQHVRLYIVPGIGKVQLAKLSAPQVVSLINAKLEGGLSPRTVQITLFVLRRALEQAVKWDLMARNVARLVDGPRVEKKEIQPPDTNQIQKFLVALEGERLVALFTLAFTLGLRRGEILGLRWSDVHFENRTLDVRQALQRNGGGNLNGANERSKLRFVAPKSSRGVRTISMPEFVSRSLQCHRSRQAIELQLAGEDWTNLDLVFATRKGTPIEPRRVDTEFKRVLKKAALPDTIRLHDLRHFAASLMLSENVQARTVMEIFGHSDISVTMNTYSHVSSKMMRDAADRIDGVFAEKQQGQSLVAVNLAVNLLL